MQRDSLKSIFFSGHVSYLGHHLHVSYKRQGDVSETQVTSLWRRTDPSPSSPSFCPRFGDEHADGWRVIIRCMETMCLFDT